jgi:hypothetical protein
MVGWLSQVMDKAKVSVNIVNNENVSLVNKDNPEQGVTSQVVGMINVHEDFVNMMNKSIEPVCAHVVNEDYMDMDGLLDNKNMNVVSVDSMDEDNPEQGLTSQVGEVINGNEDCMNVMNKDTEPGCARGVKDNVGVVVVPAIHPVGVVNMDEVYVDVDVIDENANAVNVMNKDNPERTLPREWRQTSATRTTETWT